LKFKILKKNYKSKAIKKNYLEKIMKIMSIARLKKSKVKTTIIKNFGEETI
jgi:hypothetical protein